MFNVLSPPLRTAASVLLYKDPETTAMIMWRLSGVICQTVAGNYCCLSEELLVQLSLDPLEVRAFQIINSSVDLSFYDGIRLR